MYKVYEANEKLLKYDARVADHHIWQYHRDNGFTKLGVREPISGEIQSVLRVMEGQIEAAHILNKAYIHENFSKIKVITGVNFYPFEVDLSELIGKVQSVGMVGVMPIALMMGFPVFLYLVVLEKE